MHIDHVLGLGFAVDQIGDRRFGLSESAKMEGRMIEERHGAVQRDAADSRQGRDGGRAGEREKRSEECVAGGARGLAEGFGTPLRAGGQRRERARVCSVWQWVGWGKGRLRLQGRAA